MDTPKKDKDSSFSSLAEHSYCASTSTYPVTSSIVEEHNLSLHHDHVSDLFVSSSDTGEDDNQLFRSSNHDVYSPVGFSVELSDDINFDGFNFSVPPSNTGSVSPPRSVGLEGSDTGTTNLENMWDSGSGCTQGNKAVLPTPGFGDGAAFNEPTTVTPTLVNVDKCGSNLELENIETEKDGVNCDKKRKIGKGDQKGKRTKKQKLSRLILDSKGRRNFLDSNFRKLFLQLQRAMAQTKCEGELSAYYEGKVLKIATEPSTECRGSVLETVDLMSGISHEHEMEDHRYAATMITQSTASSTVRDHQYNEQVFSVDPNNYDDGGGTLNFIESRDGRDRAFYQFAKSLFSDKSNLEAHTGAQIKLFLKYEEIVVTEKNLTFLPNLVKNKRGNVLDKVMRNITPGPGPRILSISRFVGNLPTSATSTSTYASTPSPGVLPPLTLIIPNSDCPSTPIKIPISFAIPLPADSTLSNCSPGPGSGSDPEIHSQSQSVEEQVTEVQEIFEPGGIEDQIQVVSNELDVPHSAVSGLKQSCQQQQQPSPPMEVTTYRYVSDSSTNTEPICSICLSFQCGSENTFWIRCNDPFCFDTVHTSCVGFMVTHKSHLKQLPAFYCKSHR